MIITVFYTDNIFSHKIAFLYFVLNVFCCKNYSRPIWWDFKVSFLWM